MSVKKPGSSSVSAFLEHLFVHNRIEEIAEQSPDAVAVAFDEQSLTYRQLNARANQLAHWLRLAGVEPEVLVAICVDRSLDMVVGTLGVLKAGGAFMPLDGSYPQERLGFMVADAKPAIVLTQRELVASIPTAGSRLICMDAEWEKILAASEEGPPAQLCPDNLAYVIYTSGSTGTPKGSWLTHRGLSNLARAQTEVFDITGDERVLQFASFSFDASIAELFATLWAGATICLASRESLMPGPLLLELLRRNEITNVTLPPSVLSGLADDYLPAVRTIISAGEACSAQLVSRWARGRRFINAYGPTETTVCATTGPCDGNRRKPTIGIPIANVTVNIIDQEFGKVPSGGAGEICIGGIGVGRGYLDRPDLTATRFMPDPFSGEPGARLYRTGDLARQLPDRSVEYLDRIDHQIKVRGYRIEPGEIEAVLAQHPSVQEAAVLAQETPPGDKRLVAYIVPAREATDKRDAVESSCAMELWPSVAEYFIYDEILYSAMTFDERRNNSYRAAINKSVRDKTVVEIGTGPDVILGRLCIEAGAKRVYGIEVLEDSYVRAAACVKALGLEDRITLVHGDSMKVELPERADVCVSEIVGSIGGAEGAASIINNAWRLLKENGIMIPQRSVTRIAGVSLPDELLTDPHLTELPGHYTQRIFEQLGYSFDLRLCLKGTSRRNLVSTEDVFEYLDFTSPGEPEFSRDIRLEVTRTAKLAGFLVWLTLQTFEGEYIDILDHEYCWLPVFFPVFCPAIDVSEGDQIQATVTGRLNKNGINPDYRVAGKLIRTYGEPLQFDYESPHSGSAFKSTPFYERLFASGTAEVRAKASPALSTKGLRQHLSKHLPAYMMPSSIVLLNAMPLAANGKVDRRALPDVPGARRLKESFVAPHTRIEKTLANIWTQVLGIEDPGVNDDFYESGGHSLVAAQMAALIRSAFGVEFQFHNILEAPTIAQLSLRIEEAPRVSARARVLEISRVSGEGPCPLSYSQTRMWLSVQFNPRNPGWNLPLILRIKGRLNLMVLSQALGEIVRRQHSLRTLYETSNGKPAQRVSGWAPVPFEFVDLECLHEVARKAEMSLLTSLEIERPFDLGRGPLLRVRQIRSGPRESSLIITFHHIAFDEWSRDLFEQELLVLYKSYLAGSQSPLAELELQYADFAKSQRMWIEGGLLESQSHYWRKQLAGAPGPIDLTAKASHRQNQQLKAGSHRFTVDSAHARAIKDLATNESATVFMAFLAVLNIYLYRQAGLTDILIGTDLANRSLPGTETIIGFFVNVAVLRARLTGRHSFRDVLRMVRQTALDAYANQDLPQEEIFREIRGERNRLPLFNVFFLTENLDKSDFELEGVEVVKLSAGIGGAALRDLSLFVSDSPQGVRCTWSYDAELFDQPAIERLTERFCALVESIQSHPDSPLDELKFLTVKEEAQNAFEHDQRTEKALSRFKGVGRKPVALG